MVDKNIDKYEILKNNNVRKPKTIINYEKSNLNIKSKKKIQNILKNIISDNV